MMGVTHTIFALMATSISLQTSDRTILVSAAIGSQLPDIDTSSSVIGRLFLPVSRWIEDRYPHRSLTHSFLATVVIAVIGTPLGFIDWKIWQGLVQGYFFGWLSDCFTKSGVTAFFPSQARLVIPGNARARLATNTPAEWIFLSLCLLLLIVSLQINSSGGLLRAFNSWLGSASAAVEIVNLELDDWELFADVNGRVRASNQRIKNVYQVVSTTSANSLLVTDGQNLYQIGSTRNSQIVSNKIFIRRGKPVTAQVQVLNLRGQLRLDGIPNSARVNGVVLTESLDIVTPPQLTTYNPVSVVYLGEQQIQIRFWHADLKTVQRYIGGKNVQGQLIARYYLPRQDKK